MAIWNRGPKPKSSYKTAEVYDGLRSQVLTLDPARLGLVPSAFDRVWGLLMETGYPEAVVTLVAMGDGGVSLYFSNGGGIIGVGEHEGPRQACHELLALAPAFLSQTEKVSDCPLPAEGVTRFSFLTFDGVYAAEASEKHLAENHHALSPLFHRAQAVITEARLVPPYTAVVETDSPAIGADGTLVESVGIETRGHVFTPLLERGTPVPCWISETFSTAETNQEQITMSLLRGNSQSTLDCEPLGRFGVEIDPAPAGVPMIEVTLFTRGSDIVVSAQDMVSKVTLKVRKIEVA